MLRNSIKNLFTFKKTNRSINYFSELDGIRGMAFFIVLLSHISNPNHLFFAGTGKLGVWLFFVLSAFLLSNYFIFAPKKAKAPLEWVNYAVRRFCRIYPPFFLVVTALFFNGYIISDFGTYKENFLLKSGVVHLWSIPAEMGFYVVLPFVVFLFILFKRNVYITVALTILTIVVDQLIIPESSTPINSPSTLAYLPVFLAGVAASVVHYHLTHIHFTKRMRIAFDLLGIIFFLGILLTFPKIWSNLFYSIPKNYFHKEFVYYGIIWAIFILSLIHGKYLKKAFVNRFFLFLGRISFSGYLIHYFIVLQVYKHLPNHPYVSILLIFSLTFVSASVLYLLLERPLTKINLIKWVKKYRSNKTNRDPAYNG